MLVLKAYKNATEILAVFINPVIKNANMFLVEKTQHFLFKLSAALAGDNFDKVDFLLDRFLNDAIELFVNFIAFIINIVQVKF